MTAPERKEMEDGGEMFMCQPLNHLVVVLNLQLSQFTNVWEVKNECILRATPE
jgi:hypothetical protein